MVIPAYNEGTQLGVVLESVLSMYSHIIVVDDGSADNTAQVALEYPVHVARHLINRGQGAALRTGTLLALEQGADIVVHFDADGQMQVTDIAALLEPIEAGRADVVLGSRFMGKKAVGMPFLKKLLLTAAHLFNKVLLGVHLTDPHSGFRALSADAAQMIQITQDRMAHCSEIQQEIHRNDLSYEEVPVEILYTEYSISRGQHYSNALNIVLELIFGKLLR